MKCPINKCKEVIHKDKLTCLEHWRMVPKRAQMKLYRLWKYRNESKEARETHRNFALTLIKDLHAAIALTLMKEINALGVSNGRD